MTEHQFDSTDPTWQADPARDADLAAMLRHERLAERIAVAARRRVLRLTPTPWYGLVARYGRAIAAVGIAAALIAGVALNRSLRTEAEVAAQGSMQPDLRGAVAGGSRSAVTDAVLGPDSTELFIAMAVDR